MNYAEIKYCDIANGPGVRTSLFVSGCEHHCKGCFNAIAWDYSYGKEFTEETWKDIFESVEPAYISGITLLGGEPMEVQNQKGLLPFLKDFKEKFPQKSIWCFSGFTYEELIGIEPSRCRCEATEEILSLLDVLVDGKFVEEQKDIRLLFRGSSNQRLIDIPETLKKGEVVLWEKSMRFTTKM